MMLSMKEENELSNLTSPVVESNTDLKFPTLPSSGDQFENTKLTVRNKKRGNSKFSPDQLELLHKRYETEQRLSLHERCLLGAKLGVTEHQVKVWFMNRRNKLKKLAEEGLTEETAHLKKKPKRLSNKTRSIKGKSPQLSQHNQFTTAFPFQLPTISPPISPDNCYPDVSQFNYQIPTISPPISPDNCYPNVSQFNYQTPTLSPPISPDNCYPFVSQFHYQMPTLSPPISPDVSQFNYTTPTHTLQQDYPYPSLPISPPISPSPLDELQPNMVINPTHKSISPTSLSCGGLFQDTDHLPRYVWYSM